MAAKTYIEKGHCIKREYKCSANLNLHLFNKMLCYYYRNYVMKMYEQLHKVTDYVNFREQHIFIQNVLYFNKTKYMYNKQHLCMYENNDFTETSICKESFNSQPIPFLFVVVRKSLVRFQLRTSQSPVFSTIPYSETPLS